MHHTLHPVATVTTIRFTDGKTVHVAEDRGATFNGERVLSVDTGGFMSVDYIRKHFEVLEVRGHA